MNGDEFWKLYNDVADKGDRLLEKMTEGGGAAGGHEEHQRMMETEKEYNDFKKLKGDLHECLTDKETLFAAMDKNCMMFKWRIIDPLGELEKTEMKKVHPYHPMFGLKRGTIQFLGGDDPEVIIRFEVLEKLRKKKRDEIKEGIEEQFKQLNSLNEIQAEHIERLDEIKQEKESKPETEDNKVVTIEERLGKLEENIVTLRGKQEERIEREEKELINEINNVAMVKRTIRSVINDDNIGMNQNLANEISEMKQNQQERMSREKRSPNLAAKIEKIEATLQVIKQNQLKRLARETQGIQEKTDKEQDQQIESNISEIKKLNDALRKFRTVN